MTELSRPRNAFASLGLIGWTLLVGMLALSLHLGGGSFRSGMHVDIAAEVEQANGESIQGEGGDSDTVEDGVSANAPPQPIEAAALRLARPPAARVRVHPGYQNVLERPPDATA